MPDKRDSNWYEYHPHGLVVEDIHSGVSPQVDSGTAKVGMPPRGDYRLPTIWPDLSPVMRHGTAV